MPHSAKSKKIVLDGDRMRRVIRRMAGEIIEHSHGLDQLMLIGIRTRGVPLAEALAAEIEQMEGCKVPLGILDITLYRDDLSTIAPNPIVKETVLPGTIDDRTLILCDDVLYTGRTIRSALDALIDYGRPRAVQLAVLIDRGHRELPIQADVVGRTVATDDDEIIEVHFQEIDGSDEVILAKAPGEAA